MAEFTTEEKLLAQKFTELNIKPKFDTKEDLAGWLAAYNVSATGVKTEPSTTVNTVTSSQQPRISCFFGDSNLKGEATYVQWVVEVKRLQKEK